MCSTDPACYRSVLIRLKLAMGDAHVMGFLSRKNSHNCKEVFSTMFWKQQLTPNEGTDHRETEGDIESCLGKW